MACDKCTKIPRRGPTSSLISPFDLYRSVHNFPGVKPLLADPTKLQLSRSLIDEINEINGYEYLTFFDRDLVDRVMGSEVDNFPKF